MLLVFQIITDVLVVGEYAAELPAGSGRPTIISMLSLVFLF